MYFKKKYSCVMQQDASDCGPAAVATVMEQYGSYMKISKIREAAGTDRFGTSLFGLMRAAEKLNFECRAIEMEDKNNIFKDFPKPAIVHIKTKKNLQHYIVIQEVRKDKIIAADPAEGMMKLKIEEFFEIWDGVILLLVPNENFKKIEKDKFKYKDYIKMVKEEKKFFFITLIISLLINIFGLSGTVYYKFIIDDVGQNAGKDNLTLFSLSIIILLAFKCAFEYIRTILVTKTALKFDKTIILNFYNHVIRLPMEFFRTRRIGDIVSRFNDAAKIRDILSSVTVSVMLDLIMVIGGTIVLCWYNSVLFLLSLLPVALYLILMGIFKKPLKKSNRKLMESDSEFYSYLVESLSGIEMIKSVNGEELAIRTMGDRFKDFLNNELKYSYLEGLHSSLKMSVENIFTILVLWIGVIQVLNNWYSIGVLISYNALLAYFMGPIQRIIGLQSQLQSALVASDRLFEIMDMAKEEKNENAIIENESNSLLGDIVFRDVNFRYGTREKILKGINLQINRGQKVAFVGESGSGKTTIAKLLMRFYDIESGSIKVNNQELKEIDKGFLRDRTAYVSQDYFFFSGTIRENLEFVKPELTDDEMIKICKIVQMDDFIQSLQYKYDTLLEENAANLSAGQRQRLSIAKALLRNPEILIMDEATSNLDSITEIEIERALDNYQRGNTRIMIAHRLSTIVNCDKIFVFKKGELLEAGTHHELINNKGYYYDLCKRQDIIAFYKY